VKQKVFTRDILMVAYLNILKLNVLIDLIYV